MNKFIAFLAEMATNGNEWQVFASLTEWHLITKADLPLSSH